VTLDEIRVAVRALLETDITDLPNSILDLLIQDAYDRIVLSESRWPGFEVSGTIVTVAGDGTISPPSTWADVASITHSGTTWGKLAYISEDSADDLFSGVTISGVPRYWSLWGQELKLWPVPDGVYTLSLRGFRGPIDWISLGAGAAPDLPDPFHLAIVYLAVALEYGQIEDPDMAELYLQRANEKIGITKSFVFNSRHHRPKTLNGGPLYARSYSRLVRDSAASQF